MSQFIRIRISQGSSSGPYTIYYNQVTPGTTNVAQIYGTTTPYALATSVTFSQLTGIPTYLIIVVPDTAYQIILVDNVNPCPPIIQSIPVPTPTATVTPTLTPTVTPNNLQGTNLTLQWVVRPQLTNDLNFRIPSGPISQYISPTSYIYATSIISGTTLNSPTFNFFPLEPVTNNGIVSSRTINIPTLITPITNFGLKSGFVYGGSVSNFVLKINLYHNGVFKKTLILNEGGSTTALQQVGYSNLYPSIFSPSITLSNNDVILIEYTV